MGRRHAIDEASRILRERGVEDPAMVARFIDDKLSRDPDAIVAIAAGMDKAELERRTNEDPAVRFVRNQHDGEERRAELVTAGENAVADEDEKRGVIADAAGIPVAPEDVHPARYPGIEERSEITTRTANATWVKARGK